MCITAISYMYLSLGLPIRCSLVFSSDELKMSRPSRYFRAYLTLPCLHVIMTSGIE